MPDKLTNLGFTARFAQEATLYPDLHPARVIAQYKELYRVATAESEMLAEISGKMRHAAVDMSDYPAVGDFVMIPGRVLDGATARACRRRGRGHRAAAARIGTESE